MFEGDSLEAFLSTRGVGNESPRLPIESWFGDWQILALLGRGGNAEVYRAQHKTTKEIVAIKVLCRDDECARKRFEREVDFLRINVLPVFPKFYDAGVEQGFHYVVMECLEPMPLPQKDKAIAAYFLNLCQAIHSLHMRGFVHRDIKPQNVLCRKSGELVLIDLGLIKSLSTRPSSQAVLTLEQGHVVGVGTPRYAAPEQFSGGEVAVATDIHAIGVMIHDCFKGNVPREWRNILQQATSSILQQRFQTVAALQKAIRRRHLWRHILSSIVIVGLFIAIGIVLFCFKSGKTLFTNGEVLLQETQMPIAAMAVTVDTQKNRTLTHALALHPSTNCTPTSIVREEERLIAQRGTLGDPDYEQIYQIEKRSYDGYRISLNGETIVLKDPVALESGKAYQILGPGLLDVTFIDCAKPTKIFLKNCTLVNHSKKRLSDAQIEYIQEGFVCLHFPKLSSLDVDKDRQMIVKDGGVVYTRYRGDPIKPIEEIYNEEMDAFLKLDL